MTRKPQIRVLVADDNLEMRGALAELIEKESGLELVGSAADAAEAIELAGRRQPDVALLDVRMPAGGGLAAASGIARRAPQTKVILISASGVDHAALNPEIADCIPKGSSAEHIVESLRRAAGR